MDRSASGIARQARPGDGVFGLHATGGAGPGRLVRCGRAGGCGNALLLVQSSGHVDQVCFVPASLRLQQVGQLAVRGQKSRTQGNGSAHQRFGLCFIATEHPGKAPQHGAMGDQRVNVSGLEGERFLYRTVGSAHQKDRSKGVAAGFQLASKRAEESELCVRVVRESGNGLFG